MKKFRLLLLIILVGALFVTTSCGTVTLEKAMEELDEKSSTIECDLRMDVTIKSGQNSQSQSQTIKIKVQNDRNKTYAIYSAEGVEQHLYTVEENDTVKSYELVNGKWQLSSTDSADEMTDELFDIDTDDAFSKVDGVWVGDVELLSNELSEYMKEIADNVLGLSGIELDQTSVTKFDITLDKKHVSKIDFGMKIVMSNGSASVEVAISMPMIVSEIGTTTVEEPANLPVE